MWRWTASHCVFAKLGPRRSVFRTSASNILCFGELTVYSGAYLARGNPRRAGYGGGLPHIAYSRNWALGAAIFVPARRIFSGLPHSPSIAARTWRVGPKPSGMWRWTASHCVFAKLGDRRGDFRASASNILWFGALTVHSGAYLARGDPSRAGCGGGLPRIAYSRNWALDAAIFVPARRISSVSAHSPSIAARIWRVGTHAERDVAVDSLALRIREIGPSARRFSCQRVEYSLVWRTHRPKRRVLGAWEPTPSGIRPWTASHCAFAKLGPRRGDFRASASNILWFGELTVHSGTYMARESDAERDVAVDCLALRIREIGRSARRFSCQRVEYSLVWRTHRPKRHVLGAWEPTPSGMWRWTASHCEFAKLGDRRGDFRASASNILWFGARTVQSGAYSARGSEAERDVAVD